jgi:Tfp pilus assembly protein PilF
MQTRLVDRLEAMLAAGEDTALLRFSLGNAYLNHDPTRAVTHLRCAVALDPAYSAAWKILGKALIANGEEAAAIDAYRRGIEIAEAKGDIQAAREMRVFMQRLQP